jgi:hypothetical protein
MDCIEESYDVKVSHGVAPLGLLKNIVAIKKDGCVIELSHERYFFLTKSWTIDVCREPPHIKRTGGAVEVLKREMACAPGELRPFCQELGLIQLLIQDDGLIFAAGEKEDLASDHGKVFCSYLLIGAYLGDGEVFYRGKTYENFLVPTQNKGVYEQKNEGSLMPPPDKTVTPTPIATEAPAAI